MEKEEQKKNKAKYTPIPNCPIPLQQPIIASPTALKKLAKGKYISLWYWTPSGIESARSLFINLDAQTFTFIKDDHGMTSLTPTVSEKESSAVIPDSKLPFNDFLIAIPCLIEAMGQAQWPKEQILMMSHFWDNILDHPHCSSGIPDNKQALMVYQEEQCKQWHHMTSVPSQGYDPSEINEAILESTQDHLLQEHHQKDNEIYKSSVSTFPLHSSFKNNYNLMIYLCKILHLYQSQSIITACTPYPLQNAPFASCMHHILVFLHNTYSTLYFASHT